MLERLFQLTQHQTDVKKEITGGLATFLTMAYILCINPLILAQAGMDKGAVFVATCLAASFGCILMGLIANYPIALAPSMGLNVFFTYGVVIQLGHSWQVALGAVFLSGVAFIVISLFRIRDLIVEKIPLSLRQGIATGIGLFLTLISLKIAGIVVVDDSMQLTLGNVFSFDASMWAIGLLVMIGFAARGWRGGMLVAIALITLISLLYGKSDVAGIIGVPPDATATYMAMDISGALDIGLLAVVFAFLFVDLFDSATSLVAVAQRGGLLNTAGRFARFGRALFADASATLFGASLGTSTVTTYVESTAGVAAGGRTGLTSVVVGLLFLGAIFFYPLIDAVPLAAASPVIFYVATLMLAGLISVEWEDLTEAIPVVITAIVMPLTMSIANGIALGFISYTLIKLAAGRHKQLNALVIVLSIFFTAELLLRSSN
ncbi:MAG: NCS2 family permease [Psychrobium sp.]